jgi:hypothetical protein
MSLPMRRISARGAAREISGIENRIHKGLLLVSIVRMCEREEDQLDLLNGKFLQFICRTGELYQWYERINSVIEHLRTHRDQCYKNYDATVESRPRTHAWMLACRWTHFEPQGEVDHDGHSVAALFIRRTLRRPVNALWFPFFDWTPEQTVHFPTYLHQG